MGGSVQGRHGGGGGGGGGEESQTDWLANVKISLNYTASPGPSQVK